VIGVDPDVASRRRQIASRATAARFRIRRGLPQANNVVSQAGVVADFADSWAHAASPTAHSKAAQADDAVAAGDLAEAAVNFR